MKLSILILLLTVLLCSCTKQEQTMPLTGKWKLAEQKNNYLNGGNFQWSTVPYEHVYEFRADGSFTEQMPPNNSVTGNYQVQANSSLVLLSGATSDPLPYERIDRTTFILRHLVREGEVLQKFVLVR